MSTPSAPRLSAWTVPDAYIPPRSTEPETSHESICVLNPGTEPGWLHIEALYEDRPAQRSETIEIAPRACVHLRTSEPERVGGLQIPRGVPYGLLITGTPALAVQYSRLDTTQPAYSLMTVAPAPEEHDA